MDLRVGLPDGRATSIDKTRLGVELKLRTYFATIYALLLHSLGAHTHTSLLGRRHRKAPAPVQIRVLGRPAPIRLCVVPTSRPMLRPNPSPRHDATPLHTAIAPPDAPPRVRDEPLGRAGWRQLQWGGPRRDRRLMGRVASAFVVRVLRGTGPVGALCAPGVE